MRYSVPRAPLARDEPLAEGTHVELEPGVRMVDRNHVTGGAPWRLLRLSPAARAVVERWRHGDVVGSGQGRLARTLVDKGLLIPTYEGDLSVEEIDVIVPVLNEVDDLRRLLPSLASFHVTVVDDGSYGPDVAACADEFGVPCLRLERTGGPARARNAAAATTSRRLLWFIDADVVLRDATAVAAGLATSFGDPLVAAVAPRVRGVPGRSARDGFESRFSPLDLGERTALVVPGGAVGYVPSACLMIRRDAFGDGFDESLRVGEDVDLIWRLVDHGWNVRYLPSLVVEHPARSSWGAWWRQRQSYGASSGELSRRHGRRLAPLRVDRWTLSIWVAVLLGRPGVGASILRAASERARRQQLASADDPASAARDVVVGNVLRSGGPLARAVVRTFGVVVVLAALHPRLRSRALALFVFGSAWRWRGHRLHARDVVLGVADDLAYGVGVVEGAWRARTWLPLTPVITRPTTSPHDTLELPLSPNT